MKPLLLLAALATASLSARAQTTPPAPMAGRPAADQQAKVQQILLTQRQDMLNARQQAGSSKKGLGKIMKAERAQADEQLRGVLTPDQYARYQQLLAQRKQQGKGRQQPQMQQEGSSILD